MGASLNHGSGGPFTSAMLFGQLALAVLVTVAPAAEDHQPTPPPPAVASAREALTRALVAELAVDDARRQAWAAYEIGARGLASARDDLLPLVRTVPGDGIAERRYAVIVDALVRLPGMTPADVVALAATHGHIAEAIILAAREPSAHRTMLEEALAQQLGDGAWLAVRQLLEDERSPRLAEDLARDLALELRVSVVDPGKAGRIGRFGARSSDWVVRVDDDFPPKALYRLTTGSHEGDVVLTKSVGTVLWRRREFAVTGGFGESEPSLDRDQKRIDLLAQLCRPWLITSLRSTTELTVAWSDAEAYRREVAEARQRLVDERAELLKRMIEQGLLFPESEQRFPPKITVAIDDQRADHGVPLPQLVFDQPAVPKRAEF